MIGTTVAGRYTLEAEIGRGGMGAVWRGRDEVLGRTVALKQIGATPGGFTPDALRAEREAKLAAKLNHANVVAVFDLVDEGHQQWLVMEYVEGTDLAELVRSRGRLTPEEAAPILAQTASALAAAHGAGIVHRDVKPSNILVGPDGQVKLSDFGIARTASDPSLTKTGLVTGSPAYLSPEVASGQQATAASDAWSWGATLFHALEGQPPYQVGDNVLGAMYRIVHEEPPRPQTTGWLTPLLDVTMTRDPTERWSMAAARDYLEAGPTKAPVPTPVRGVARHPPAADAGTRVLPLAGTAAAASADATMSPVMSPVMSPAMSTSEARTARPLRRRSWLLVAAACLVVLAVTGAALWVGLDSGRDDGDGGGTTSPSAQDSDPPPTQAPKRPTKEGMVDFVRTYIDTVVRDPASAFGMLTPKFQAESDGREGYEGFWGTVDSASIESISADLEAMQVAYTYTFEREGETTTDDVVLLLAYRNGTYLIDNEL